MVILKALAVGVCALIAGSPVIMGVYFCLDAWLRGRKQGRA